MKNLLIISSLLFLTCCISVDVHEDNRFCLFESYIASTDRVHVGCQLANTETNEYFFTIDAEINNKLYHFYGRRILVQEDCVGLKKEVLDLITRATTKKIIIEATLVDHSDKAATSVENPDNIPWISKHKETIYNVFSQISNGKDCNCWFVSYLDGICNCLAVTEQANGRCYKEDQAILNGNMRVHIRN